MADPTSEVGQPILLDLYSCAGGMAKGYTDAGFSVFGVDIDPQPNYPYPFHQGDALAVLDQLASGAGVLFTDRDGTTAEVFGEQIQVRHASPPCQGYLNLGAVNRALGRRYEHEQLIGVTRDLLLASGGPYVIENVADARTQLLDPVRICGTGLGRPIRRHRLFESNLPLVGVACNHGAYAEPKYWTGWRPKGEHRLSTVVQIYGNAGGREHWPAALGVDWMTAKEMTECVPPSYAEHLGRQILTHRDARKTAS